MLLSIIASYFLVFLCFSFIINSNHRDNNVTVSEEKEFLMTLQMVANDDLKNDVTSIVKNNDAELINFEMIGPESIGSYFENSLDSLESLGLSVTDIFRNQAQVSINAHGANNHSKIMRELRALSDVDDIEEIDNVRNYELVNNTRAQLPHILVIVLISLVLFIIAIGLSLDFQRNRDSLKSLIRKGASSKFLISKYLTKGFLLSLISWLIGVALFILCFYLLRLDTYTDLRIFDIKFIGIVFILPLALITFITSSVIWAKLMTAIKE
jgi:cell division protein FtsX